MTTSIVWPVSLPCFRFEPYNVAPRPGSTEMTLGMVTQRAMVYQENNELVSVEMILSAAQEQALRTFFKTTTSMGTQSFLVDVLLAGTFEQREANFYGAPPTFVPVAPGFVRASFALLTKIVSPNLYDQLIGLSWRLPCINDINPTTCTCLNDMQEDLVFEAPAGKSYQITFRIRGLVESNVYTGGTQLSPSYFYRDMTGSFPNGNVYRLSVSSPNVDYYINKTSHAGDRTVIDYEVTIPIDAGATVTLSANATDGLEINNATNSMVPDDDPLRPVVVSQPYDGQFAQIDVLAIVEI